MAEVSARSRDHGRWGRRTLTLEANRGVGLSFHPAHCIGRSADNGAEKLIGCYAECSGLVRAAAVIGRSHGMIPFAGCVITRAALRRLLRFRSEHPELRVGDVVLQTIAAAEGGVAYLDEVMSVYRHKLPGSWTARNASDPVLKLRYARDRLRVLEALDAELGHQYSDLFEAENIRWAARIARSPVCSPAQKVTFYHDVSERLSGAQKLRYWASSLLASFKWLAHRRKKDDMPAT